MKLPLQWPPPGKLGPLRTLIYWRAEELRRQIREPHERHFADGAVLVSNDFSLRPPTELEKRLERLEGHLRDSFAYKKGSGRPAKNAKQVLAAFDEWLVDPDTSLAKLARKHGFKDRKALESAMAGLRRLLLREGIEIPKRSC
jgi:hypothetical protein